MLQSTTILAIVMALPLVAAIHLPDTIKRDVADFPGIFSVPIDYPPGDNARFLSTWEVGSERTQMRIIMDLASQSSWLWGPNTVNWGNYLMGGPFLCSNVTIPYYSPNSSTNAELSPVTWSFGYGGGSKFVYGNYSAIDNLSPKSGEIGPRLPFLPALKETVRLYDTNCTLWQDVYQSDGIFGLSRSTNVPKLNSSLRYNLQHPPAPQAPLIDSASMSVFLRNSNTTPALGTFQGEILFGGIDTSAFIGPLVNISGSYNIPDDGYHVPFPNITVAGRNVSVTLNHTLDNYYGGCLVDSGTASDIWPVIVYDANYHETPEQFEAETGLVKLAGYPIYAYPSACADIPANATFDFTWSSPSGEAVTIKVPMRNYARDSGRDTADLCPLNLNTGYCTFGATFLSAAYLAIDDDTGVVALAQSGEGVGGRIPIASGEGIPGLVT